MDQAATLDLETEMTGGALTYVLVLMYQSSIATVPGYGSIAECEKAASIYVESRGSLDGVMKARCIPGPVEAKR